MIPVTYSMPAAITPEMIRALKAHPDTAIEDRDEWHTRLGWLISAWDVLIEHRQQPPPPGVFIRPLTRDQIDDACAEILMANYVQGRDYDEAIVRAAERALGITS